MLTSTRCDVLTDAVAVVIARLAAERRPIEHAPRVQPGLVLRAPSVVAERTWGGGLRAMGISGIGALPGGGLPAARVAVAAFDRFLAAHRRQLAGR